MNDAPRTRRLPDELHAWLTRSDLAAPDEWDPDPPIETLGCHPDLVERLASLARPLRVARRVFVAGCPVIHHPSGPPIATACGTSWLLVRAGGTPGVLDAGWRTEELDADWLDIDPWCADIAFARGTDLLRQIVARAFERAAPIE